jgi:hypothetical protein
VASSPITPDRRLVVRAAPGLGQQRFQRVPQVGNRGFRGRIIAYHPDPQAQLGRGGPEAVLVLFTT